MAIRTINFQNEKSLEVECDLELPEDGQVKIEVTNSFGEVYTKTISNKNIMDVYSLHGVHVAEDIFAALIPHILAHVKRTEPTPEMQQGFHYKRPEDKRPPLWVDMDGRPHCDSIGVKMFLERQAERFSVSYNRIFKIAMFIQMDWLKSSSIDYFISVVWIAFEKDMDATLEEIEQKFISARDK